MITVTAEQLTSILRCSYRLAWTYVAPLNLTLERYDIAASKVRAAAFLAQVGHESGRLSRCVENLNYSAEALVKTWPSRFAGADGQPNALALDIQRQPVIIANVVYSGRMGNGDAKSGDGWRYRGRGLIQVTGRENYEAVSRGLGINAISNPEVLESPLYAALSAGWYWDSRKLNALADAGDMQGLTRKINGGFNGLDDRMNLYKIALATL